MVTANLVHDHFKTAHSLKRGSGTVEVAADPQTTSEAGAIAKSSERGILLQQIDALLSRLAVGRNLAPVYELAQSFPRKSF